MAEEMITIPMEEKLKTQFEKVCAKAGMSISDAMTLLVEKTVSARRFPFEIPSEDDPFYSEANMARLKQSIQEMEAGQCIIRDPEQVED